MNKQCNMASVATTPLSFYWSTLQSRLQPTSSTVASSGGLRKNTHPNKHTAAASKNICRVQTKDLNSLGKDIWIVDDNAKSHCRIPDSFHLESSLYQSVGSSRTASTSSLSSSAVPVTPFSPEQWDRRKDQVIGFANAKKDRWGCSSNSPPSASPKVVAHLNSHTSKATTNSTTSSSASGNPSPSTAQQLHGSWPCRPAKIVPLPFGNSPNRHTMQDKRNRSDGSLSLVVPTRRESVNTTGLMADVQLTKPVRRISDGSNCSGSSSVKGDTIPISAIRRSSSSNGADSVQEHLEATLEFEDEGDCEEQSVSEALDHPKPTLAADRSADSTLDDLEDSDLEDADDDDDDCDSNYIVNFSNHKTKTRQGSLSIDPRPSLPTLEEESVQSPKLERTGLLPPPSALVAAGDCAMKMPLRRESAPIEASSFDDIYLADLSNSDRKQGRNFTRSNSGDSLINMDDETKQTLFRRPPTRTDSRELALDRRYERRHAMMAQVIEDGSACVLPGVSLPPLIGTVPNASPRTKAKMAALQAIQAVHASTIMSSALGSEANAPPVPF